MPAPGAKTPAGAAKPAMPAPKMAPKPVTRPGGSKAGLLGLLGLVVGLVAGYGAGRVSTGTPVNPLSTSKGGYQEGYDAAHKKLLASGLVPQIQSDVRTLSGTVKAVDGNTLTLDVEYHPLDPLDETTYPTERVVTVGKDAKITQVDAKDPAQFQAEMQAFQQAIAKGEQATTPPSQIVEKAISLADLKPGDTVMVTADEAILSASSFTAISVAKNPSGPVSAPQAAPTPSGP